MAAEQAPYRVLAKQLPGSPEHVIYRTGDRENASCFAESHFINRHAHSVRAVAVLGDRTLPLTDRQGREYVWQRQA